MKKELKMLQNRMAEEQIDAYLIMTDDFHGSEYVGDYFKSRKYISGFTGSAGTLVVLKDAAGLWTDGRYFLQAERQLEGSGITLYRSGQPKVPTVEDFLCAHMEAGQTLGFDGRCIMADYADALRDILEDNDVKIRSDLDLVGDVWENRPPLSHKKVWILDERYAGVSRQKKIEQVREVMARKATDWFLLASLEDICWLLNVRGDDVECTPVVLSYLLMSKDQVLWYVQREAVSDVVRSILEKDGIEIREYAQVYEDVSTLPSGNRILYDRYRVNDALRHCIPAHANEVDAQNPTVLMKAMKNPVEVENEKRAHICDGVAVTKFIFWLKTHVGKENITEISAAKYLEECRKEQENYLGPSFAPILAYGEHGAIVHYSADEASDIPLQPEGLLLADTGGHYLTGSTDITRTIVLGPLTMEEKELYTMVLKGHIQLAAARFLKGCTGRNLDVLARTPLWEKGYDYNHGTGHGVGYLLSVHEGPNSFRYRPLNKRGNDCEIAEGMITSDEPGVYLEGKFGIRLENMIACVKDTENNYGDFLRFESLTMVPFDREAILPELMTKKEILWLNRYHETVRRVLAPHMNQEEQMWLEECTRAL